MEDRDEDLILEVAVGRTEALSALYERYRKRIMTYAFYILGNRSHAEDVLQETFLRVFRHAGRFRAGRRFSAWIYSIAANLCRDELRKRMRRRDNTASLTPEQLSSLPSLKTDSPAVDASRRESIERLRAAIFGLTPEQREAIALRYFDSMTYAEIADIIGCPIGTVQSRLHAALEKLRDIMADLPPPQETKR